MWCSRLRDTFCLPHWSISPPLQTLRRRPAVILWTLSRKCQAQHSSNYSAKRALSTARNTFKHLKPTAGTFPFIPRNTVTRKTTSTRGGKKKALSYFAFSYYLLDPKSIEKLRLQTRFHQSHYVYEEITRTKRRCAFFFPLNDLSRNISILKQQEQILGLIVFRERRYSETHPV